ncbi:ATP-binding cassette sub- B member 6, mitochondrial [Mortierella sp. AM989]|nr:ATP-binding cassette sub- B member 6, mitochondrial [Mortierella sp. AM989]
MEGPSSLWHANSIEAELTLSNVLLSYTVAVTLYRRISQESPLEGLQTIHKNDAVERKADTKDKENVIIGSSLEDQNPQLVDQAIVRLYQAMTVTYLLDLGLITYKVYLSDIFVSAPLVAAKVIAWIAFTSIWVYLGPNISTSDLNFRVAGPVFGWIAFIGTSYLARSFFAYGWILIASGVFFEKDSKVNPWNILILAKVPSDQIQIGIFLIRYALLFATNVISAMNLCGVFTTIDLKVPKTLFKDPPVSGESSDEPTISRSQQERLKELDEEEKAEAEAFKGFWLKIKLAILLSYPWGERRLQFLILIKFFLMLVDRAINLLVPMQTERILRSLTQDGASSFKITNFEAWPIVIYVLYSYLQRYSSFLSIAQRLAWEPVSEYSESSITLRFFEHVHGLSMQYLMDRKSGELMQIMSRGAHAMQSVSTTVLFRLLPTVADVVIAIVYFWISWSWKFGVIVTFNSGLYLVISAYTTRRRSQFYREWIEVDDGSHDKAVDSLVNYETVKYFTAESFEVDQYKKGFEKKRGKSFQISYTHEMLDMLETVVWTMNSMIGCMLCAYEISRGERSVGSFMSFIVYSRQLEGPVDSMAWYFKSLRKDFVSMEKILKLLEQEPTVKDIPDAKPLIVTDGEVVFDNVCFQYDDNKKGLKNISFTAPKGKTVAIVGPTGSGKSTLLRLAFRFWDPTSGRILIDGQDIAEMAQKSVREQIGVVPQEAVLFNDSILYNIHYGRVNASKEDIINAAKAAQIHESILKFKDGYESTVGERGAKLSGGEKQRIALARTILKNPPIILLDEATSALDSATESQIQSALTKMTENRTTIVVAHRLSTIKNADLILCIRDGEIVERGTHAELIQKALSNGGEGEYYKMWQIQLRESNSSNASTVADVGITTVGDSPDTKIPCDNMEVRGASGTGITSGIDSPSNNGSS